VSLASTEEERFNTVRAIQLAVVAALGGFMFGFDTAVINGAVTAVREDVAMSSGITGFVVASALLGAALGATGAGRLSIASCCSEPRRPRIVVGIFVA
jgi:MFS family permease